MKKQGYQVIGTRPIRHDAADKVTGRAVFGADFKTAGLLHGFILRSPHAHARIVRIDTSRAAKVPGVKAIVTAQDLPQVPDRVIDYGEGSMLLTHCSSNILARGKVLYRGHAVAAVAATSVHIAEQAARSIKVEYEVLPSVVDAVAAMQPGAPILHEDLETLELGRKTGHVSNIAEHFRLALGDVEAGFAKADVIVEREFHTATVHQGYIEPHCATALWNRDGRVHIWCSTQGAFVTRDVTAWILDLPVSRVKVIPTEVGGSFGGKIRVYLEPVAALLSRKAARPVKIAMPRRDVLEGTGPTPGSHIKVKMGARKDGRLIAAQASLSYEAGAFPGAMAGGGAICIFSPYDIANVAIDGFDVVVNKPSTASYRAPGATNACFAAETVVDELAGKLGLDPIDFRLRNAVRQGSRRADGIKHPRIGCVEVLQAMKASPQYRAPLDGPNRGRGVALGYWLNAGRPSSCSISVNTDGTVGLVEGSIDLAGTRTSLAMQAAEVLGIRTEDVHPSVGDTDSVGYSFASGGSRTTFATGWAVYKAAQDVVLQMRGRAAVLWGKAAAAVTFEDGVFRAGRKAMCFKELAARLDEAGGPVVGRGAVNPSGVGPSIAGCIADVEVDPETGKVSIIRFTSVQDAGKAIHPSYVEGQMQGGSAQGIGWALNEEYFMSSDGFMLNSTLLDYRMPTCLDLPQIETVIVEVPNPGHPFGVRGVGEANIIPPPGAIANAIHRAAGVRLDRLPMNPCTVMEAIWKKGD
jgi:xanthine dehydrogenase molybdenum-binding subunit